MGRYLFEQKKRWVIRFRSNKLFWKITSVVLLVAAIVTFIVSTFFFTQIENIFASQIMKKENSLQYYGFPYYHGDNVLYDILKNSKDATVLLLMA